MTEDDPIAFGIRFSREAEQNAVEIVHDLAERTGDIEQAVSLYARFYDEAGKLSLFPERRPIDEEDSLLLGRPVRRLLVGRYHLSYRIDRADDGPLVIVMCIRHAASAALTEENAARILKNQ